MLMLNSLKQMKQKKKVFQMRGGAPWFYYLKYTQETNFNFSNFHSLTEVHSGYVLDYVRRTLEILDQLQQERHLDDSVIFYVEETLKWSEVAKCGTKQVRKEWQQAGYDLTVHNIGSSQIYQQDSQANPIVQVLIETHGLLGQYLMGEVNLDRNFPLYDLVKKQLVTEESLREILHVLNHCVIGGVSQELYQTIEADIHQTIDQILKGNFPPVPFHDQMVLVRRFQRLCQLTDAEVLVLKELLTDEVCQALGPLFNCVDLWYFHSVFQLFSITEVVKVLLLIVTMVPISSYRHLSFFQWMKDMYLDYHGVKMGNLYKKRIIEHYLSGITCAQLLNGERPTEMHVHPEVQTKQHTIEFTFVYSEPASKLIAFCESAYERCEIYTKAVFLLYDLFGFRRDAYDRFYNEVTYLNRMSASIQHKGKLVDYLVGDEILDVGPGGGALMDLIVARYPKKHVTGIDLSQNVVEALEQRKKKEQCAWDEMLGDALQLPTYFSKEQFDTIIFSSILHELFSYIEIDGKKFQYQTIEKALRSAFTVLRPGGRMIIRDGIQTEPTFEKRLITFYDCEDLSILDRYCQDFQGREITYQKVTDDTVCMKVNDAMEFLYTYTWGPKSYPLEVQEQFGYFTPTEYQQFLEQLFQGEGKVIEAHHFLQDGYEENLLTKIQLRNEAGQIVSLPDSTCIFVVEKNRK